MPLSDAMDKLDMFTSVLMLTLFLGVLTPLIPILTHLKWSEEQQRFETLTEKDPNKQEKVKS